MSRRGGARSSPPDHRVVGGIHPVRELLRAGAPVHRIVLDADRSGSEDLAELLALATSAGITVVRVTRGEVDEQAGGLVHQGVVALAPPFAYADLDVVLDGAGRGSAPGLLVALDGITDPHNLGSIARTAEAVGADGLVVPARRAAPVTATAEKAAAGALAHLPVVRVTNLVRALKACQQRGWWVVGLASSGESDIADCPLLTEPLVLVIGSEGDGLAHLSQVHCDSLVRLPMRGHVAALNASVAAAVALYEVHRRREPPVADRQPFDRHP